MQVEDEAGVLQDHPRVCGEHGSSFLPGEGPFGSSPRMRGALRMVRRGGPVGRIIPAYAGSTKHDSGHKDVS